MKVCRKVDGKKVTHSVTNPRKIQVQRSLHQVGKSPAPIPKNLAQKIPVGKSLALKSRVGRNPVRHRKIQTRINRLRKETQNGSLQINGKIILNQHRRKKLQHRVNRHQNRAQVQKEIK